MTAAQSLIDMFNDIKQLLIDAWKFREECRKLRRCPRFSNKGHLR